MKTEDKKFLQETIKESLSIFGYAAVIAMAIIATVQAITGDIDIMNILTCVITVALLLITSWSMYPIAKDIISSFKKK